MVPRGRETSNTAHQSDQAVAGRPARAVAGVSESELAVRQTLVQRGRETSNTLFNELEQWERYLKSENLDVHILAFCKEIQQKPPKQQEIENSLPDKQKSKRTRSASRLRGPS